MTELYPFKIHELHEKLKAREISSWDLVESVYKRIQQVDPKIGAYLTLTRELAFAQAEAADKRFATGQPTHPLTGIPLAIKDNICIKGVKTTCASKILESHISIYNATVIEKIQAVGSVILGRANMDEFAMGSSTENSAFGITKNPWNLECIPGGSSGGSAAAVAADECIAAVGSDTGGSIRQPAACCGVVGLKPTYGRVSRYGLVAFASSLDQIGPITKDVRDCAIMMNTISGHDPLDSTSADLAMPDFTQSLGQSIEGLRIGIPKEYFIEGMDPEVEGSVREAIRVMEKLGARIQEISLPHTQYAVATYYILATAEASSNLARYDGVRYGYRAKAPKDLLEMYMKSRAEGFGPEVKRRIMLGTYALSSGYYDAYYLKAQKVRTLIKRDFDEAFTSFSTSGGSGGVDVIVVPTSPTPAFRIGEKTQDPLQMYLSDIFTISVNLAGIPGIALPCGFSKAGLPIGMQVLGRPFDEAMILRVAYAYEQATEWHKRKPRLT
jgi:aspartyl-tRNA(Asn)/glutamyl-tRNA(Gln) amidotransferase subunit A